MTTVKEPLLELTGTKLTRRSFLGWTAKVGIIAVTTKIIPATLDDLEEWKSVGISNEHLIRSELWCKELQRILLEDYHEWKCTINTRQEVP